MGDIDPAARGQNLAPRQTSLVDAFAEHKRVLTSLMQHNPLRNAVIDDGDLTIRGGTLWIQERGSIQVEDGGELRVLHPSGEELLSIWRGSGGKYRLSLRRDNGASVLQVMPHGGPGADQFWAMHANDGGAVLSDDAEAGVGLARPWLAVQLHPLFSPPAGVYAYRTIDAADISSKTLLWSGRAYVSHPRIQIDGVWGQASGSNTTTYTLSVGGVQVGSWTEGGGLVTARRGPFDVSDQVQGEFRSVDLYADASGSGAVACQVLGAYLRQS